MIAVDSSAIIAILRREPEAEAFRSLIKGTGRCVMSTASALECGMVVGGQRGRIARVPLQMVFVRMGVDILPFDERQLHFALVGFLRFGKGRHKAGLNFGDCFSYGLAMALDAPLLFKGGDFGVTDVKAVI